MRPVDKECYVYLMDQPIDKIQKIGISVNPETRKRHLESTLNRPIDLVVCMGYKNSRVARKVELKLHQRYSRWRVFGEWFTGISEEIFCREIREIMPPQNAFIFKGKATTISRPGAPPRNKNASKGKSKLLPVSVYATSSEIDQWTESAREMELKSTSVWIRDACKSYLRAQRQRIDKEKLSK